MLSLLIIADGKYLNHLLGRKVIVAFVFRNLKHFNAEEAIS
jgi:hypothetical protein